MLTSWVDVVALRASPDASKGNLGAFLLSGFNVSPHTIVLPLGNLIQASRPTKKPGKRKTLPQGHLHFYYRIHHRQLGLEPS